MDSAYTGRAAFSALLVAALAAGCSALAEDPTAGPVAAVDSPDPSAALDVHHPGDATFFQRLVPGKLLIVPPPKDVADGARQSTAVVVSEVADVRPVRTIRDGSPGGVPELGVVLKVEKVLRGALRPELREVVVTFIGERPPGGGDPAAALRSSLPRGRSVWFLRWNGRQRPGAPPLAETEKRTYSLVSLDGGVLIQGNGAVDAPTYPDDDRPANVATLGADAQRHQRLSELVATVLRTP
ncbi:hypothetical protein [Thermomonospora umbrina]|uniref:Uncharacterized protein n=1 Tax=Thermomonospora umbrina TaxID=111806 RepID=A0A3D9SQS6_9ACTN|nr:hypothetical protein [Thermomonospora umbrina]REE96850.1 hypothetical protein DFJ69_2303 [Thermomonospora umbrina]